MNSTSTAATNTPDTPPAQHTQPPPAEAVAVPLEPRAAAVRPLSPSPLEATVVMRRFGTMLLPLGLLVVFAGGVAVRGLSGDTDRLTAVVVGGLGGLTISIIGGFLYIGAWLSRLVEQQRVTERRLGGVLVGLVDVTVAERTGAAVDVSIPVTMSGGRVLHRRDCTLLTHRTDLQPADIDDPTLMACRVCRP